MSEVDSLKQVIKAAMLKNMPPDKLQALSQSGPAPGEMGREGDFMDEPPPIDEAALTAQLNAAGAAPPTPPQGPAGPPPGAPQAVPPLPPQYSPMAQMAAQMVPGVDPGPAPPEAEERFQSGIAQMDAQNAKNRQSNQMLMQKMGVTPQQLQAAMAGAGGGQEPQGQGARDPGSLIAQALMKLSNPGF